MRDLLAGRRPVTAVLAIVVAVVLSAPAFAAPTDDPRAERDRVRRREAEVASHVDALEASQADVTGALATLEANVAAETARLADAERAAQEAQLAADAARAAADAAAAELTGMEDQVRALAVEAYISEGSGPDAEVLLSSDDLNEAMQRRELLEHRQGSQADAIDQLRAAREDLDIARQEADAASQRALEQHAAVQQQLTAVQAARDQQQVVLDDVEARLDASLAEAAALAGLDAQLSQQIAQQEAALAARARAAGGGSGGRHGAVPGGPGLGDHVRGITVNVAIADGSKPCSPGRGRGSSFGGGGYRSPEDQWRLREAHCPDPANSPPSACSPPTARPGSSLHERGLAIDFTYNGRLISSRSSPGFVWLANNAGRYGFYNLPSEPWHWSTNGE